MECHKYLKRIYDPSIVSLKEISRFSKCIEFFKKYFSTKNEYKNNNSNNDGNINNKEKYIKWKV